jgi:hypothetical protein
MLLVGEPRWLRNWETRRSMPSSRRSWMQRPKQTLMSLVQSLVQGEGPHVQRKRVAKICILCDWHPSQGSVRILLNEWSLRLKSL